MIQKLSQKFGKVLYIQLWEKRIRVAEINSKNNFDEKPLVAVKTSDKNTKIVTCIGNQAELKATENGTEVINPFSHPRTLLSDFHIGEKLLQLIIQSLYRNEFLKFAPLVVIHPMEKLDGNLTMIEKRALKELALGAGAREVVVFEGKQLDEHHFDYKSLKHSEDKNELENDQNKPELVNTLLIIGFAIIAILFIYHTNN